VISPSWSGDRQARTAQPNFRDLQEQTEQAWCLTLVTIAVVAWTTDYYGLVVESLRRDVTADVDRRCCPVCRC
jgi:hypothetical protein